MKKLPPAVLVLAAITSVQLGGAIAKHLLSLAAAPEVVLLRVGTAAIVLIGLARPVLAHRRRSELLLVLAFGAVLATMNLCFYEALARIPLGVTVTIEFLGPFGVAVVSARRLVDAVWVVLAAAGVVLLTGGGGAGLPLTGVVLALAAALSWAAYILLNQRVGAVFGGNTGLAVAMGVAALGLLPSGVAAGASRPPSLVVLSGGAIVGVLSSAVPYSLELEALRRLPAGTFGVLMSLEPAVAAVMGYLVLGETLTPVQLLGIGMVVSASSGAARSSRGGRSTELL